MEKKQRRHGLAIISIAIVLVMLLGVLPTTVAQANSAYAPIQSDAGSGIVFEKSGTVAVKSEILDIVVGKTTAEITAKYKMVNLTNEKMQIRTIFVSPKANDEESEFKLTQNGKALEFTEKNYSLHYFEQPSAEEWENALISGGIPYGAENAVSAVTYFMEFEANEEIDIEVSYKSELGRSGGKESTYAQLLYYLTPAKYWDSFKDLTINVTLEESRPRIGYSSIKFKKTGDFTYQAKLSSLPENELSMRFQQPFFDDVKDLFSNPFFYIIVVLPVVVGLLIIGLIIFFVVRHKRKKKLNMQKKD